MSKNNKQTIEDVESVEYDNEKISSGSILFIYAIISLFLIAFTIGTLINCSKGIARIEQNMKYINESIDDINSDINSINYRLERIEKRLYEINNDNNKIYIIERYKNN